MNSLTVKLPPGLDADLEVASQRLQLSKSELVRRAISAYCAAESAAVVQGSALSLAGDLVGCFHGGPGDLSSNPKHMDGFGQA